MRMNTAAARDIQLLAETIIAARTLNTRDGRAILRQARKELKELVQ
ncbi:MAG: hypothetical protein JNM89_02200 [Hyphomicrobiaceae bacterium]|nr:hypothetical protein [Hyphomicrobiaceae bacterium]